MGIEKTIDFRPTFEDLGKQLESQLQSAVQGQHDLELKASVRVTDVKMDPGASRPGGDGGYTDPALRIPDGGWRRSRSVGAR